MCFSTAVDLWCTTDDVLLVLGLGADPARQRSVATVSIKTRWLPA
jgi:hypothetical protein